MYKNPGINKRGIGILDFYALRHLVAPASILPVIHLVQVVWLVLGTSHGVKLVLITLKMNEMRKYS